MVVALDEDTQQRLQALDGRILEFRLTLPPADLRVSFSEGSIRVNAETGHAPTPPHTIVRGPTVELIQGLITGKLSNKIVIDGDEALLSTLQDCLSQLRPDLSAVLEPIAAQPGLADLVGQAEYAFDAMKAVASDLFGDLQSTGKQHFADKDDLARFAERLQDVALRVDRLHARADLLRGANRSPQRGTPSR